MGLTSTQQQAVAARGNVLVVAGAGTGAAGAGAAGTSSTLDLSELEPGFRTSTRMPVG